MELGIDLSSLATAWENLLVWFRANLLVPANLIQLLALLTAILVGRVVGGKLRPLAADRIESFNWSEKPIGRFLDRAAYQIPGVAALILVGALYTLAVQNKWPAHLLKTALSLIGAWVIIRPTSAILGGTVWSRVIAAVVMIVAGLNIFNLLQPTMAFLDGLSFQSGEIRLSLLNLIKGAFILFIVVRLAQVGSGVVDRKLNGLAELTPSLKVLLAKLGRILFFTVAVLIGLSAMGIDLTAFALVGGTIGVGLGFGLQKVFANLISGIILLLDRSIKPGDVIEVGRTIGRIESLGARYVAVITRDGAEYLIPNEDLITNQVINLSYSSRLFRLKIPVGIAYGSDVMKARELALECARGVDRVLAHPAPVCHLKDFGESSLDLELRIWIKDPERGVTNVGSAIRLAVWQAFKENSIELPFPQRDIRVVSMPEGE